MGNQDPRIPAFWTYGLESVFFQKVQIKNKHCPKINVESFPQDIIVSQREHVDNFFGVTAVYKGFDFEEIW